MNEGDIINVQYDISCLYFCYVQYEHMRKDEGPDDFKK